MERPRYNNKELIQIWAENGINTPKKLETCLGITLTEGEEIVIGRIVPSPEIIGRTLEIIKYPYEDGAYFLDPWIINLRKQARIIKIKEAKKGKTAPTTDRQPSEEARRNMSKAQKNKAPISQATRERMLEGQRRRRRNERDNINQ